MKRELKGRDENGRRNEPILPDIYWLIEMPQLVSRYVVSIANAFFFKNNIFLKSYFLSELGSN